MKSFILIKPSNSCLSWDSHWFPPPSSPLVSESPYSMRWQDSPCLTVPAAFSHPSPKISSVLNHYRRKLSISLIFYFHCQYALKPYVYSVSNLSTLVLVFFFFYCSSILLHQLPFSFLSLISPSPLFSSLHL